MNMKVCQYHQHMSVIILNNTGYFSHPCHALAAWCRSQCQNACFWAFYVHQLLQFTPNIRKLVQNLAWM